MNIKLLFLQKQTIRSPYISIIVVQCNCGEDSKSGVLRADPDEPLELLLLSFLALLLFIFYLFVLGELE